MVLTISDSGRGGAGEQEGGVQSGVLPGGSTLGTARRHNFVTVEVSPRWLAGDHHVHSRFSVGWDDSVDPPRPIVGGMGSIPFP
jgi:hypothetical protein